MKNTILDQVNENHESILKMNLGVYQNSVGVRIEKMQKSQFASRLWNKDPGLWKQDGTVSDIANSMGWLNVVEKMLKVVPNLEQFKKDIFTSGLRNVVLMGMGGSSLASLVFQRSMPSGTMQLPFTVLDSTDPATIEALEKDICYEDSLFIVAGKSGSTSETTALFEYFYNKVKEAKGDKAGDNFVAITDPGSPLMKLSSNLNFRHIFLNYTDIGGRYSALSYFGMVPAILLGVDVRELLERALKMVCDCAAYIPVLQNPGILLGGVLGELANQGRNKLTFLTSPSLSAFASWLEQLIAESTGKEGKGILPVISKCLGEPSMYSEDRVFIYISFDNEVESDLEDKLQKLAEAGHPVLTFHLNDRVDLGQEFFRWEMATASAGAILEINPFDQFNVQESKDITNRLLKQVQDHGQLPVNTPIVSEDGLSFFSSQPADNGQQLLEEFFGQATSGNYIAVQVYLTENPDIDAVLNEISCYLEERLRLPVTIGYGPRYLHSTGQYHKGGPNTGLFLQLTAQDAAMVPIPDRPYTFGLFKQAQALGDLEALRNHNRRVISINLGLNPLKGLKVLKQKIEEAQREYLMNVHW